LSAHLSASSCLIGSRTPALATDRLSLWESLAQSDRTRSAPPAVADGADLSGYLRQPLDESDDERLRNGLTIANRQRPILCAPRIRR